MTVTNFRVRVGVVLLVSCAIIGVQQARAIVLTFQGAGTGASASLINFAGGTFSFTAGPTATDQFDIQSVSGGTVNGVPTVGDPGYLNPGGPFLIGAISGPPTGTQTATVTGTSVLNINGTGAYAGEDLTGNITWKTITTSGTGGNLNLMGLLNLTSIVYTGTDPNLVALAAILHGGATDVISFSMLPPESLSALQSATGSGYSFSYGGSIFAVPEATTMLAGAFLLLPFGASTLRILRKRQAE